MLEKCVKDGFWRHSPRSFRFWSGKATGGCLQIFKTTSGCLRIALTKSCLLTRFPVHNVTVIASQLNCLFQDTWSPSSGRASVSGPQKPFLRPDVHTHFVRRPFRPICRKRFRLLLSNSLSRWMCGRLCNLRGAVKRMKPEQPQQLDDHSVLTSLVPSQTAAIFERLLALIILFEINHILELLLLRNC